MQRMPAARRTELLHRMMLARCLAESMHRPLHDEAVEVGVLSALGSGDILVPGAGSPVELLIPGRGDAPQEARVVAVHLASAGVLFCPGSRVLRTPPCPAHAEVDAADVEAIARTAAGDVASVRRGATPCLLAVRPAEPGADPVEVLATRMRIDHQLDESTLRAIERDARAHVAALLAR